MRIFGLIGHPLEHSFSPTFFKQKFERDGISDSEYRLFPLESIEELTHLIHQEPNLAGLNVTIPYKEAVIPLLDQIDPLAQAVGAVNVIRIIRQSPHPRLLGFNTDCFGFRESLLEFAGLSHKGAIILGTGGASKAAAHVLANEKIPFLVVSRTPKNQQIGYHDLSPMVMETHPLIINATPVGMSPHTSSAPQIPYNLITPESVCFDMIYNPEETEFLRRAREQGAKTKNGLAMLHHQAEESWKIWTTEPLTF